MNIKNLQLLLENSKKQTQDLMIEIIINKNLVYNKFFQQKQELKKIIMVASQFKVYNQIIV
ncbi:hypothetical protein pb186bvf_019039 [Paramecium bursaria]